MTYTLAQEAWRHWPPLVLFAGRVIALQGTHPVVSAGLVDHSTVLGDPWRRAEQTLDYALRVAFADDPTVVAGEIRELHRHTAGHLADGSRYHAWNAEAWAWVHLSALEALLFARRLAGPRFTAAEEQQLLEEWNEVGRAYSVARRFLPATIADLDAYVADTIDHRLDGTETAHALWNTVLRRPPAPPVPGIGMAWPLISAPAGIALHLLVAGCFPPGLRQRMGIRWTPLHQAHFDVAVLALRAVNTALPDRVTTLSAPDPV